MAGLDGNIFGDVPEAKAPAKTGLRNIFADAPQAQPKSQDQNIFADVPAANAPPITFQLAPEPEKVGLASLASAGAKGAVLGLGESFYRFPDTLKRILVDAPNELIDRGLKAMGLDPKKYNPRVDVGIDKLIKPSTQEADKIHAMKKHLNATDPGFKALAQKGQVADEAVNQALDGNYAPLGQVLTDPGAWAGFIGQAAPSLLAAYLSGGSTAFMGWMEGMDAANSAADFEKRTGVKLSPTEYARAVTQVAVINGLLEKTGFEQLLHGRGKNLLHTVLKNATKEGGTEFLQNLNSNAAAKGYDEAQQLLSGSLQSVMGGVGVGAAVSPATHYLGGKQGEDQETPPQPTGEPPIVDENGQPPPSQGQPPNPPAPDLDAADQIRPDQDVLDQFEQDLAAEENGQEATKAPAQEEPPQIDGQGKAQTEKPAEEPSDEHKDLADQLAETDRLIKQTKNPSVRAQLQKERDRLSNRIEGKPLSAADQAAERRRVVPSKDDLGTAIQKLGGIDTDLETDWAGRLKDLGNKAPGLPALERPGKGRSLDDLAESLHELGYLKTADASELAEQLDRVEHGEAVHSIARSEADMAREFQESSNAPRTEADREAARMEAAEADQAELDDALQEHLSDQDQLGDLYDEPAYDQTESEDGRILSDITEIARGIDQHATEDLIERAAMRGDDNRTIARTLIDEVIHGRGEKASGEQGGAADSGRGTAAPPNGRGAQAQATEEVTEAPSPEGVSASGPTRAEIDAAGQETNTTPTEGQKSAGNYRKGVVRLHGGVQIAIENPKGSTRSGTDADGKPWQSKLAHDYGYIKGTKGADGDPIDVFLGPSNRPASGPVFVVDQIDPQTGTFDESKVMLGFNSKTKAKEGYLANYPKDWQGLGTITTLSQEQFKSWLDEGSHNEPVGQLPNPVAEQKEAAEAGGSRKKGARNLAGEEVGPIEHRPDGGWTYAIFDRESRTWEHPEDGFQTRAEAEDERRRYLKERTAEIKANPESIQPRPEPREQFFARQEAEMDAEAGREIARSKQKLAEEKKRTGQQERRKNPRQRKRVDEMSPEDMRQALLVDDLTGLGNRRAYEEAEKLPVQVSIDADSLKWINDNMSPDAGDSLLKAIGEAIHDVTNNGYHISGDEFIVQANTREEAEAVIDQVVQDLGGYVLEVTRPNGDVVTKKGLEITYGIGADKAEADYQLKQEKQRREAAGQRASRGEQPPGVVKKPAQGQHAQDTQEAPGGVTAQAERPEPPTNDLIGETSPQARRSLEALLGNPNATRLSGNLTGGKDASGTAKPDWQPVGKGFEARAYVWNGTAYQEVKSPGGAVARRGMGPSGKPFAELEASATLEDVLSGVAFEEFQHYFDVQPALPARHEAHDAGIEGLPTALHRARYPQHSLRKLISEHESLPDFAITPDGQGAKGNIAPEAAMARMAALKSAVQSENAKLEQRRKGASSEILAKAWVELGQLENAIESSRRDNPAMWQAYERRQGEIHKLKSGDKVGYYAGGYGDELQTGTLDRKFAKNWRVIDSIGQKLLIDPAGLVPIDKTEASASQPEEEKSTLTGAPTASRLEDFGEVLEGARKHYAQKLAEANQVDTASQPLSKSWPEPDYPSLIDAGADPAGVALVRSLRDEIPAKPRSHGVRRWVDQVEELRSFAARVISGEISAADVFQAMQREPRYGRIRDHVGTRAYLYQEVGHERSLKGVRIHVGQYSVKDGVKLDPPKTVWSVEKQAKATALSNMPRVLGEGETKEAAIEDFKRNLARLDQPAKRDIRFEVWVKRGEKPARYYIGKKIGRDRVELESFDDLAQARRYLQEHHDDLVAKLDRMRDVPNMRRNENEPRVGADHRNGQIVTPEMFSDAFGFRGVQFGEYVEGARRQQDLNQAYDALMDLSGIIGVPSQALSLNGELGLAFGARGRGGRQSAKAHFESDHIVINLTKRAGAGSLAHEWWHALDNYFARQRERRPGDFVTESPRQRQVKGPDGQLSPESGVRPEIFDAFQRVMQAVNRTRIRQRSERLDRTRAKQYWSTGREMTARAFESYVIEKLRDQGASNDYLANIVSEDYWNAAAALGVEKGNTYPYPEAAEIPVIREAFGHFFDTVQTRETDRGVAMFSLSDAESPPNTKSAAFERWFGNSKVVDENGHPLVVYHGTAADFSSFHPSDYEGGIYFTASPRYAAGRARIAAQRDAGAASLMPVYLSIKNPAPADMSVAEAKAQGYDGLIRGDEIVAFRPEQIKSAIGNRGTFDPNDPRISYSLGESQATSERSPWQTDFPRARILHSPHDVQQHPDYRAAKAGDSQAAYRLVRDTVSEGDLARIAKAVGDRKPIVVGVHAEERAGRNKIPVAYARRIARALGYDLKTDIVQAEKVSRGGSDGFHRLANPPRFAGPVESGRDYVIVDDTLAQGGTIAALKGYIENHGGRVILASALMGKQYSATLAPTADMLQTVRARYGEDFDRWWVEQFGYGLDQLTQSELRYLSTVSRPESVRDRVLAARRGRGSQGDGRDGGGGEGPRLRRSAIPSKQARPSAGFFDSDQRQLDPDEPAFARKNPPPAFRPDPKEAEDYREKLRKTMASHRTNVEPISLGRTPAVFRALGAKDLPLMISRDVVRKATNGVKHVVPMETVERLPEELYDPLAVFRSRTHADSLVAVTELKDADGKPVVVAVDLRARPGRIEVNRIASLYGKDGRNSFAEWSRYGLLAYESERARVTSGLKGLQLPNRIPAKASGPNAILHEADIESILDQGAGSPEPANLRITGQGTTAPLSADTLRSHIHAITRDWKNRPPINVVQSEADLPANLQQATRQAGVSGRVRGVWFDGRAHIVADANADLQAAEETLLHEVLGHYGLRGLLGDKIEPVMRDIYRSYRDHPRLREIVRRYGLDMRNPVDQSTAGEEMLAHMVQTGERLGLLRRVFAKIRAFLRNHFPRLNLDWSDADVWELLERARRFVTEGGIVAGDPVSAPRFSLGGETIIGRTPSGELAAAARHVNGRWRLIVYKDGNGQLFHTGSQRYTLRTAAEVMAQLAGHALVGDYSVPRSSTLRARPLFTAGFTVPSDTLKDQIIYQLQDRFVDLKRIQGSILNSGARIDEASDAYLREALYYGRAEKRIRDFRERHVEPLLKKIKDLGLTLDEVNDYLYARHAVERNAEMHRINPEIAEGEGSGMTDDEADLVMQDLSAKSPALARVAFDVDRIIEKSRRLMVNAGLEREETVRAWESTYQHYVPLRGFEETGDAQDHTPSFLRGRGFDTRGRERSAFGRRSRAANILVNVLAQYESTAVRAEKNRVGQSLLRLVQANPNPDIWKINPVEYHPRRDPRTGLVMQARDMSYRTADNVLTVKVDGKDRHIVFKSARGVRLAKALRNFDMEGQNRVLNALGRFNRLLAALSTSWNPEFILTNFVRDLQTAALNLSDTEIHGAASKIWRRVPKAMAGIVAAKRGKDTPWSRHFEEFERAGGKTGWIDANQQLEDVQAQIKRYALELERSKADPRELTKKLARGLGGSIVAANEVVENGVRLASFVTARELGMSVDQAANLAKNLTVNFNRRGALGRTMNALYLFFNASMQGSARLLQVLTSRRGRRVAAAMVTLAAVQALVNALIMANRDDDDKRRNLVVPDYVKERNWLFMLPDGEYVKIPLPYGWNVFKVAGDQLGEFMASQMGLGVKFDPAHSLVALGSAAMGAFNPLGAEVTSWQSYAPTVIRPGVQIATNEDWNGRKIYPEGNPFDLAPEPDSQLKWDSTNPVAVAIASALNEHTGGTDVRPGGIDISPITLEHITEFLGGGAMRFLSDGGTAIWQGLVKDEPVEDYQVPFKRRVFGSPSSRADRDLFYDNVRAIEYAQKDLESALAKRDYKAAADIRREYEPELRHEGAAKRTLSEVRRLRQAMDQVKESNLSDDQKRDRTQRLKARMDEVTQRFNGEYLRAANSQ